MGVEQSVPLVGRTHELERSLAALDLLDGGRGGLISLVGDRGVGKSAVAGALTEEAARRGLATAWGRPMAGRRGDTPYGAWGRALDRVGIRVLSDGRHPGDGHQPLGLDQARRLLLQVVDRPTVLVLDDLHRADDESRWLVEHLLDDLERVPLLLVVTTTPVPDDQVTDVVRRWSSHRVCTRLLVDRLSNRDTAALLSAVSGDDIGPSHPLVVFADGTPGAAVELAEQWRSEVGRNRLISRIATYVESHNGSRVLSTLAALERPFTEDFKGNAKTTTISNMVRQPVEITLALLHSAQLAGIVDHGAGEDRWAITHPMFADAALSDPVRTAAIRRQLAEALLVIEAEERSGITSAECAGQFIMAGQPNPDVSWRAARWYLDTGQPQAAKDLVMATVTTALDEEDQIALNRLAGVAFAALGEQVEADDYLTGMINRARVRQMVSEFADAVADLLVWVPIVPDRTRLELIEEALRTLPQLQERTAVRLLSTAARALVHVDHYRAMALWAQADAVDWRSFERSAATDVLALPVLHGCQADQDAIADAVRELDGLDQRFGHGHALAAVGRLSLALIRGTRDQIARALLHLDAALRRWPSPELAAYGAVARMAMACGDADHDRLSALTEDAAWLQAPPHSHAGVLLGVGHLVWEQVLGELPPLSEPASRACQVNASRARLDMELTALGIKALTNPDLKGELRERLDAMGTDADAVPRDFRWAGELAAMAAFAAVVGDVAVASRAADLLSPHLEELAVVLPTGVAGPVGLHVAHARLAAGDTAAATLAVEAALRCCERVGAPSWEAPTRLLQARIALLEKRLADARSALRAVTRLAEAAPMPRVRADAQRLEAQVDSLGRGESVIRLSERELEVLTLVAAGATNRQVARTLSISPKTVEYHLAGAFRTLGATNRTEAVELARRAALL